MKKILHVVGHLGNGGDTRAIINILEYIKKNKLQYEFEFLTHNGCNKDFVTMLKEQGIKVYILDNDARIMGPVKYYREISKILRNNKYDAIHFHTSFQSCIGLIAAKRNGIRIRICHSHTSDTIRKTNKLSKAIILPLCRFFINIYSTKKVCCSNLAGQFLFGKKSDYKIIYNGIDVEKFKNINFDAIKKIKEKYSINDNCVVIGQVGRFDENKNQQFTINLASTIKNGNYKFLMIGDGENLDQIKKEVKDKKIDNVYFTGNVDNVNDYMYLFDFLLLPSKYGEGLPTVVIEEQIVNEKAICLVSDIVTSECNLGNVRFIDVNTIEQWIAIINNSNIKSVKCDYKKFDINQTSEQWIKLYR